MRWMKLALPASIALNAALFGVVATSMSKSKLAENRIEPVNVHLALSGGDGLFVLRTSNISAADGACFYTPWHVSSGKPFGFSVIRDGTRHLPSDLSMGTPAYGMTVTIVPALTSREVSFRLRRAPETSFATAKTSFDVRD